VFESCGTLARKTKQFATTTKQLLFQWWLKDIYKERDLGAETLTHETIIPTS